MRTQKITILTERDIKNYRKKFKRQRELRNRYLLMLLTFILIIGLTISYHAIVSEAGTDTDSLAFKYYTSIMVEYGDTLWSIAHQYTDEHYDNIMDYINEVISINHIKEDQITTGQYLIIPYYSYDYK